MEYVSYKDDFYKKINSKWINSTILPSGESRWSTFNILQEDNLNKIKNILDDLKSEPNNKINILNNQYFLKDRKCNLNNFLLKINEINDKKLLSKFIIDNFVLNNFDLPINFIVYPSFNNSNINILHLETGGLGLPDKDYYFKTDKLKIRNEYKNFMKILLQYFSLDYNIDEIFSIEDYLAEFEYSNIDKRNPNLMNNELSFEIVNSLYPELNLQYYFDKINKDPNIINLINPIFLKNYVKLWNNLSIDRLKKYFIYLYILNIGKYISIDIENIFFNFYKTVLLGITVMKPLWKRSILNIENNLGMLLSKLFIKKHFSDKCKDKSYELISYLKDEFKNILQNNTWMNKTTKIKALKKLDYMIFQIGYPKVWREYDNLEVTNDNTYLENILNCKRFNYKFDTEQLYKNKDLNIWHMNPHEVNAYYSPQENKMVFPAGILQEPFFYVDDIAKTFGGIGTVIGHEMTHGFDDEGRKFDFKGNLNNWWSYEDSEKFNKIVKSMEELFSNQILLNKRINGKLTLGENLADLGGVTISLNGLKNYIKKNELKDIKLQDFFENYCNIWKCIQTNESLLLRLDTDPHSPPNLRVNLILPQIKDFVELYNITEDDKMYIEEKYITKLWLK